MKRSLLHFAFGATVLAAPLYAAPVAPSVFARELDQYLSQLSKDANAPPGFVMVVVQGDHTVYSRAFGVSDVVSRKGLTLDHAMYTGSTTKAYTGLLAAELDRRGLMPLSTSLADVWPDLRLPDGLNPREVTAARLLSHSAPIDDGGLTFISNVTGEWTVESVPTHLARYARPMNLPFRYSNFGPFLYSVMVQQKLGLPWRDALRRYVLKPLDLRRTSARLEDFAPGMVGHCSTLTPGTGAWRSVDPKPTPLLNAAGGVYTRGRDAAAFLTAFTSEGVSEKQRIPVSSLEMTAVPRSTQDSTTWGFHRDHYGLGWDIATYEGVPMLLRAGVYTGCRAMFAVFPDAHLGIGVLTLSDVAGNSFNAAAVQQAYDLWIKAPGAVARGERRIAAFSSDAKASAADLSTPLKIGIPVAPANLTAYFGRYHNDRLGMMTVEADKGLLRAHLGLFTLTLIPTGTDRFENQAGLELSAEPVIFPRDANGRIREMHWGDRIFTRLP